jgi:3-oxoacyl-[acyl-carrier protein] reductase
MDTQRVISNLKGMTALVTGASRGVGRGIAIELGRCGCSVIVNYRSNQNAADEVVAMLLEFGVDALAVQADVGNEQQVAELFSATMDRFGHLDILVNNAGTYKAQEILDITLEDWEFIQNTNLRSTFLCSREAMKVMRVQKSGRIINISSVSGQYGSLSGAVHYGATKGGQFGLTKTLARTAAPLGITVNAVAPGLIETELFRTTLSPEKQKEYADGVPLGLGQVEDVGHAVVYLAGPGGRYITGSTIDVNGGAYYR